MSGLKLNALLITPVQRIPRCGDLSCCIECCSYFTSYKSNWSYQTARTM